MSLEGRTLFVTGASRGIGLAIAQRAARDGANVIIAAKTSEPHPHLPGTIHDAAESIEALGGKALPLIVDVRDEASIQEAVRQGAERFGGIDIAICNASAISKTSVADTTAKRFDLMHQVNYRGTFFTIQACLPFLKQSTNPHVLVLSPPLTMAPEFFAGHVAYTISKFGMSMCVLGMAEELRADGVALNALWPRYGIATAAIEFAVGDREALNTCRTPDIMSDAAYEILTRPARDCSGNFFLDDEVLHAAGVRDFTPYRIDPAAKLRPGMFIPADRIAPLAPPEVS